ncbi:M50 family metallopeptidase [Haliscomenobacter hydrossis]|uniref:Peptidase M50 domain-containing protein n=1 Tax=Haliscomenobacter hydrossis (strain ATCC 27775 / DSM 1100 / LMG 10767 / O) TaxID=760192 RepID=F4KT00_HALH1|nr:M50 family metallopeptidase [Haliscomenobacter hydrossis]AEE49107.1 hypothetical protein Halhy_1210 [Haliscomenobacter hydrossis DSM 1100]
MSKKKQSKIGQLIVGGLIGAGIGYLGMYAVIHWVPDAVVQQLKGPGETWWEGPFKISVAFVALWAALAAHELGHLLTGLAQGFKFHLYVAGFLGVRRNPLTEKVEAYFNRDPNLFGGVAATLPIQKSPDLRQKLAAIVAAGPLISLLGALLGIPAYGGTLQLTDSASPATRIFFVFLLVFALSSLMLFLATTIPGRTGAFFTDRARFFRLIGGGKAAQVEQAMLELLAQSYTQQPYGQMDPTQIELVKTDDSQLMQAFAYSLEYYYHLDRGETTRALAAATILESRVDEQPITFKVELLKDIVFAYAFLAKDPIKARQAWDKTGKLGNAAKDAHALLAKTALFLAEGNHQEARACLQQGLAALPAKMQKYSDQFYWAQYQVLAQEIG